MADQDLRLKIEAAGGDKAAGEVGKVTDAQKKLGKQTGDAAKPTEKLTEEQKKLNAVEGDYIGILSQINPALGAFVDGGLKALRITGDLANKNINLKKAYEIATAAIKNNANALKLIGAAGAAAIAITLLVVAYKKLKEEAEAATEAMRKNEEQINKFKATRRDRQQAIEDIAGRRREGGLTAEESQKASRTAEQLSDRLPSISEQVINEVVGALSGAGLSIDQLKKAAILQQQGRLGLNDQSSLRGNVARVESAIRRFGDQLETFRKREEAQRREVASEAISAASSRAGGAPEAIQEFIRNLPGPDRTDEEIEQLAQAVRALRKFGVEGPPSGTVTRNSDPELQALVAAVEGLDSDDRNLLLFEAKSILQLLENATRNLNDAAEKVSSSASTTVSHGARDATLELADLMRGLVDDRRAGRNGASATFIQAPNSTFNGPATTRRDLTENGETELEAIRGGY